RRARARGGPTAGIGSALRSSSRPSEGSWYNSDARASVTALPRARQLHAEGASWPNSARFAARRRSTDITSATPRTGSTGGSCPTSRWAVSQWAARQSVPASAPAASGRTPPRPLTLTFPAMGQGKIDPVDLAQHTKVSPQSSPHPFLRRRVGHDRRRVVDVGGQVGTLDHLGKQKRPGAGHDLIDGVAAATKGQPPALAQLVRELVEGASHMWPDARGRGQMRKRVEVVRVAAILRHE